MNALPAISVIIPAFNEERYLVETLRYLRAAEAHLKSLSDTAVQVLVVDNDSSDGTAAVARALGADVIHESEHNIGKVRNAGAAAAEHDLLVFLDADTVAPPELLIHIARLMREASCAGGVIDAIYRPKRLVVRAYLRMVRKVALLAGMGMGACQFCRRDMFQAVGGYDESYYMGEDVEFFWRLRAAARRRGLTTCFVRDLQVVPSCRRFDSNPLWRTLLLTLPLVVFAMRRKRAAWRDWYDATHAPRG